MIDWLNQNQGFVMSLLTLVYVVATIVIVVMNAKSISEMRKTREAEGRPYVLVNLNKDPRDMCFYLRISNHGKSGAIIRKINILPHMKLIETKLGDSVLNGCLLAPNQMLQFILLEKWEETCDTTYSVDIFYMTTDHTKEFHEQYKLVTQYAHQMGYTENKKGNLNDVENALTNIACHLDSIRTKM